MSALFTISLTQNCEMGYTEFNNLCFHDGDIEVLQKMINNSINSGVGDDCDPYDSYCGSPNPYMDQEDAWFWIIVDGIYYQSGTDSQKPSAVIGIQRASSYQCCDDGNG